jgi:ABC-type branched-subunit amino acid transport system ATPase component
MLEVESLCSGYGPIRVVEDCSLRVGKGEIVGILGHNGMGKTTLLRTIMGHLPIRSGTVRFDGEDLTQSAVHIRARRGLSLVPQGREIFPNLTARDNIRMGMARRPAREEAAGIEALLAQLPRLRPLLDRPGGLLSGGEQQILAVARCLAAGPRLILLDEPTEGIQPSIIDELIGIFHAIRERQQVSILLVEQNLDFITALADRILVIHKGKVGRELDKRLLTSGRLLDETLGLSLDDGEPAAPSPQTQGTTP